jgi:hypothetical protein
LEAIWALSFVSFAGDIGYNIKRTLEIIKHHSNKYTRGKKEKKGKRKKKREETLKCAPQQKTNMAEECAYQGSSQCAIVLPEGAYM